MAQFPEHHSHVDPVSFDTKSFDGYSSSACTFPQELVFNFECLRGLFKQLDTEYKIERIKAVLHTDKGWQVFNIHKQQIKITKISASKDNRIEIIGGVTGTQKLMESKDLEKLLKSCFNSD